MAQTISTSYQTEGSKAAAEEIGAFLGVTSNLSPHQLKILSIVALAAALNAAGGNNYTTDKATLFENARKTFRGINYSVPAIKAQVEAYLDWKWGDACNITSNFPHDINSLLAPVYGGKLGGLSEQDLDLMLAELRFEIAAVGSSV